MYATLDDLYVNYGKANALRLLETAEDTTPLLVALKNASSEIDGYLAKRYKVPLKNVPDIVKSWACTIAMYKRALEYGGGLTEEKRKRYEDIFNYLKDINKGVADLPDFVVEVEENGNNGALHEGKKNTVEVSKNSQRRVITRGTLSW